MKKMDGDITRNFERLEHELSAEISSGGIPVLLDHLRLCGDMPESYGHDSSAEKLYSKYTDALLCESYKAIGIRSLVIKERSDVADVEAFAKEFSFIADAKSFSSAEPPRIKKILKFKQWMGGNVASYMQWLFAHCTSFPHEPARYTSKQAQEMYAFLHTRTWRRLSLFLP